MKNSPKDELPSIFPFSDQERKRRRSGSVESQNEEEDFNEDENFSEDIDVSDVEKNNDKKLQISDEIIKLSKLKNEGLITEEEFKKAKNKLMN